MGLRRYQIMWFRGGQILLPEIAKTTLGLIQETEPVRRVEAAPSAVEEALRLALSSEPKTVPHPDPANWPESVVQRACGARSWRAFVERVLAVVATETENGWEVSGVVPQSRGSGETIVQTTRLPCDATPRSLAEAMLEIAERFPVWKEVGASTSSGPGKVHGGSPEPRRRRRR